MDDLDRTILRTVQRRFPLSLGPYRVLGRELGLDPEEVHRRVTALRRSGVIRRLGPLFSPQRLGLSGHLVAARVDDDAVDALAEILDRRDEVTHNYLRTGRLNVWFTVTVRDDAGLDRVLDEVRACRGVAEVHAFTTLRVFKLDASFPLGDNDDG